MSAPNTEEEFKQHAKQAKESLWKKFKRLIGFNTGTTKTLDEHVFKTESQKNPAPQKKNATHTTQPQEILTNTKEHDVDVKTPQPPTQNKPDVADSTPQPPSITPIKEKTDISTNKPLPTTSKVGKKDVTNKTQPQESLTNTKETHDVDVKTPQPPTQNKPDVAASKPLPTTSKIGRKNKPGAHKDNVLSDGLQKKLKENRKANAKRKKKQNKQNQAKQNKQKTLETQAFNTTIKNVQDRIALTQENQNKVLENLIPTTSEEQKKMAAQYKQAQQRSQPNIKEEQIAPSQTPPSNQNKVNNKNKPRGKSIGESFRR